MNVNKLSSFISVNYCQYCKNKSCNSLLMQENFETNELTFAQINEVNEFSLKNFKCANHARNEEFNMFRHNIIVYYTNGTFEEKDDNYTLNQVSEFWANKEVDYVKIIFSDF